MLCLFISSSTGQRSPIASFDGSKLQQALLRRDSPSLAHNANIKCVCAAIDVEVEGAKEVARARLALGVTTFAADVTEETGVAVVAVACGACGGVGGSRPSRAHCTQRHRQSIYRAAEHIQCIEATEQVALGAHTRTRTHAAADTCTALMWLVGWERARIMGGHGKEEGGGRD